MTTPNVLTKALPVWSCTVDVQPREDYPVLARAVFTFTCDDGRPPHTYTEERVSNVSPEAIAKLARDQHAQLVKMDALRANPLTGTIDLDPQVADVVAIDQVALDQQAKASTYAADISLRISHLKAIELQLLDPADDEVVAVKDSLLRVMADPAERATLLSLL